MWYAQKCPHWRTLLPHPPGNLKKLSSVGHALPTSSRHSEDTKVSSISEYTQALKSPLSPAALTLKGGSKPCIYKWHFHSYLNSKGYRGHSPFIFLWNPQVEKLKRKSQEPFWLLSSNVLYSRGCRDDPAVKALAVLPWLPWINPHNPGKALDSGVNLCDLSFSAVRWEARQKSYPGACRAGSLVHSAQ